MTRAAILMLFGLIALSLAADGWAQEQCPMATSIQYPVDTQTFQIAQDYGVASQRHNGRLHTGEDWFNGRGLTAGQTIRAAATGRVTYSAASGWGRDGGVVIIEHTFPDGSILYTQYGHIEPADHAPFPPRFSCVDAGDPIGVIGNSRPAPHLHFEVRSSGGDTPGPGYTWGDLAEQGWLRPAQTIANMQARLNPAHAWLTVRNSASFTPPPLLLNDNSLLVIDLGRVRRITADGRVMWRRLVDQPPVSVTGFQAGAYLTYPDGTIQQIDILDGALLDSFRLPEFRPDAAPIITPDGLIYHTSDGALMALTPDRRGIRWRLDNIPLYNEAFVTPRLIALLYSDALRIVSPDGRLLSESQLRAGADLAQAPDGSLIVYTHGGLWRVNGEGVWSELLPVAVPPGGSSSAVTFAPDGRLFLTDGSQIYAYTPDGQIAWQGRLPDPIGGRLRLTLHETTLLLTSSAGDILAIRDSGGICGLTRVYGDARSAVWHDLGADGVLRIGVGDVLAGFDWERFGGGC